jgi:hypothetical protein
MRASQSGLDLPIATSALHGGSHPVRQERLIRRRHPASLFLHQPQESQMKRQFRYSAIASLVLATMLAACGGSSTTAGGNVPSAPVSIALSGTAATGAPFGGAEISIFDKTNTKVGSGKTEPNGSYAITLSAGATAPFVLQAVRDDLTLVSIAADSSSSTINITPITNLIASRLSSSGNPANLAAELKANPDLLDPVKVNASVDEIVALLKPLLDAVGATANPLTGKFAADGTGSDRALDSLLITITPSSATSANIEVAVKQQTADGVQPVPVQFTSGAASTAPTALPAVTSANLLPSGTAPLIADLLQRMTACFALPTADRVNAPNPTSAVASDVKAAACKTIFYNDDPAAYKGNGKLVGVGPKTSFNGIFKDGGTGMVFDRGSYEFTRDNGDLVVSYRSTDKAGNVSNDTFAVRADNAATPAKLGLIGNQYDYDGSVMAYQQLREFPKYAAYNYYSTGYAFNIPNDGKVKKVIVTSPKGDSLTLVVGGGSNILTFPKKGISPLTASGASFIRLRSVYADAANGADPAAIDVSQFFAPARAEDAEIASYPAQSTWKFDYYTGTDIASSTLAATQYHKTRARPLTIPELQTQGLAKLTPGILAEVTSGLTASGLPLDAGDTGQLEWLVADGALAPTQIRLWGRLVADKTKNFDDAASVSSIARSGIINCVPASGTDMHCDGNGKFAAGMEATGVHLWARNPAGREFAHYYAFYGFQ